MARYVPDVHTRRWVIISPKRFGRPDQYKAQEKNVASACPFCEGNEKLTPPEIFRAGNGSPNGSGWNVRVVPNLYPITDIHEVIIHSPNHNLDFEDLSDEQNIKIFTTFRGRFNFYRKNGQVLIFTNHGKSTGASQVHPHSQLVVIPNQIKLDALELEPVCNLISEDQYFFTYCPEFSQWPYEVWFAPKENNKFFGDINDAEIQQLVINLKLVLNKLRKIMMQPQMKMSEFAYNIYIYPLKNWYLRIIPRLMMRAGFELGTGIQLNIVDPHDAAGELRLIQ